MGFSRALHYINGFRALHYINGFRALHYINGFHALHYINVMSKNMMVPIVHFHGHWSS